MQKIDAQAIEEFYGLPSDISKNSESGYILFYQSREWRWRRTGRTLFCFLNFSLTDSSSPSHPAPPQVRPLWSMCQSSAPVSPSGFYLVYFFSLSLSLFWFLSFSHLHLDCTLIWKAKMLNSMIGEEKVLHQAAIWCSQPGRIWCTYRQFQKLYFIIFIRSTLCIRSTSMMCHPIILPSIRAIPLP